MAGNKLFREACQLGKPHRNPYKTEAAARERQPPDIVRSDAVHVESISGTRHLSLPKEAAEFCFVHFHKNKSDVLDCFKALDALVANRPRGPIRASSRSCHEVEWISENIPDEKRHRTRNNNFMSPQRNGRIESR